MPTPFYIYKQKSKIRIMANKANINEAEVLNLNQNLEGTQEQSAEPQVANDSENPTPKNRISKANVSEAKKVKIRTAEEINCMISGINYSFAKGKEVLVPQDVAAILSNSQKAFRI